MYNRKTMEEKNSDDWLKNLPLQSENIGFQAKEMIRCAKCQRANPPNRLKCLYCAAELEISEAQSQFLRPNLRKLESWEKGFNVIFNQLAAEFNEAKISEIARTLKIEKDVLRKIIESGKSLPVARAESLKEAEIAQTSLRNYGIESDILSDETLNIEKSPRRLRGIEFHEDKLILILFNEDEIVEISKENIVLIVSGSISERKIDSTESYNKKGDNKILDSTEMASFDSLIDIYSREDSIGYRIAARGFDFSCLAVEKGLLAKENIKKVAEKLRDFSPNAECIEDYQQVKELLTIIWEIEQKSDSKGLQRSGVGKFNVGSVTTVSNLSQFTKYSRLRRNLL